MSKVRVKEIYVKLSENSQSTVLSDLIHQITIAARDLYADDVIGVSAPAGTLIAFNELQHKISGQLSKLVANDKERYPDDVFIEDLFHYAASRNMEETLENAFQLAITFQRTVEKGSLDDL